MDERSDTTAENVLQGRLEVYKKLAELVAHDERKQHFIDWINEFDARAHDISDLVFHDECFERRRSKLCGGRLDVFRKVAEMANDFHHTSRFINVTSYYYLNPLALALFFQEDIATVKYVHDFDPEQCGAYLVELACRMGTSPESLQFLEETHPNSITANAFKAACKDPDNPELICYLAHKVPKYIDKVDSRGVYPLAYAMNEGVQEHAICALVEAAPSVIAKPCKWPEGAWPESAYPYCTPLQQCRRKGYSGNLLDLMISKLRQNYSKSHYFTISSRISLCEADLKWITEILRQKPGNVGFFCLRRRDLRTGLTWEGPNFFRLLELLFLEDNGSNSVRLDLPQTLTVNETDQIASSMAQVMQTAANGRKEYPRTKDFSLSIPHASYAPLLGALLSWPNLQVLKLSLHDNLEKALPFFCKLVGKNTLVYLSLRAPSFPISSLKRKASGDDSEIVLPPLLDAIARNTSLNQCLLFFTSPRTIQDDMRWQVMLEILRTNTTLTKFCFSNETKFCFSNKSLKKNEKVFHVLNLNLCGRGAARKTSTSASEFVEKLASVEAVLEMHQSYPDAVDTDAIKRDYVTSIQYGLLHECTTKWCR